MIVYLAYAIPFIVGIVCLILFRHRLTWWELLIPVIATTLFILIAKWICVKNLISDTEYLGGYITEVRYYEDWNERVSCRHPIYCTSCSGSGKHRSCRTYVCGHRHAYDVDYHPEHWTAESTLGSYSISYQKYNQLLNKFKVNPVFKELHRNYHTNDGDMYHGDWTGDRLTLEPVADTESYDNRPQASHGIYSYQHPDSFEIKKYKPFNYPEIKNGWHQEVLLGYNDQLAKQKLQAFNALYGHEKEMRVFLLVFKNQPIQAGFIQQRHWQNGNMNEFVVCVGIDDANQVQWSKVFTWCENQNLRFEVEQHISASGTLNLPEYVDFIEQEIVHLWKRKDFNDFEYLQIEPTPTQLVWIFSLTLLINIGMAYWNVTNEFET